MPLGDPSKRDGNNCIRAWSATGKCRITSGKQDLTLKRPVSLIEKLTVARSFPLKIIRKKKIIELGACRRGRGQSGRELVPCKRIFGCPIFPVSRVDRVKVLHSYEKLNRFVSEWHTEKVDITISVIRAAEPRIVQNHSNTVPALRYLQFGN